VGGLWESVAFIGHCVYWVWYLLDVVLLGVEFTGSPGNIGREYWTLRVSLLEFLAVLVSGFLDLISCCVADLCLDLCTIYGLRARLFKSVFGVCVRVGAFWT